MTPEERFDRIDSALAGLVEAQRMQAGTLSELMKTIGAYVTSSDARLNRIESNLDGLIRALTAEHPNGKTSH